MVDLRTLSNPIFYRVSLAAKAQPPQLDTHLAASAKRKPT